MKKGISNILVLALVIVNLVLTVILIFTFLPMIKKTNNLVTKICDIVDLEIGGEGADSQVTVADLESVTVLFGEETTNVVNLKDNNHAKFGATINLNKKSDDYETMKTQIEPAMSQIASAVNRVVQSYDSSATQAEIEVAATAALQELFASDCIYSVSFTQYVVVVQ